MIPISCTHFPTFGSIGAAAETIILKFPPKLSKISLNTFLFKSTPTDFSAFVTWIIEFTIGAFPLLSIDLFIFLCKFSINNGTASNAVGFDSCKFGTIYFKPSHIAIEHPLSIGNNSPIVDSYVWWSGKTEKNLSVGYIFT